MKIQSGISLIIAGVLLVGCGSMRPPSTDPYYPGYHARDASEVEQDYRQWQQDQEYRAQQEAKLDSLLEERSYQTREFTPYNYDEFNFYGNRYSPWYSYPYDYYSMSRWHYPQYRQGYSFNFRYSNLPWYVDAWWADDYLWERHFWDPYPYGYYGGYASYSPWYDPYYYHYGGWRYPHGSFIVIDSDPINTGQRPHNRVNFRPSSGSQPSASSELSRQPSGMPIESSSAITPALYDREQLILRRPRTRGNFEMPGDRVHGDKNDNGSSIAPPPSSGQVSGSIYDAHSGRSGGSSGTNSSAKKSSSGKQSSASSSSNDTAKSKSKRPRNRRP